MTPILATLIDGDWIIAVVVAIIGAGGAVWAKAKGRAEGRAETVSIGEPVPVIRTSRVKEPPSWDQHVELQHRVTALEHTTAELRRDLACQFRELLQAGGERELRLAEKLDGIARGIHHRVDEMMRNCQNQCGSAKK